MEDVVGMSRCYGFVAPLVGLGVRSSRSISLVIGVASEELSGCASVHCAGVVSARAAYTGAVCATPILLVNIIMNIDW